MMGQKQEIGDGRAGEENGRARGRARKRSHRRPQRCRASKKETPHEAVNDIVKAEPTALRPSRRILAAAPPLPPTVVMRWDQSSSEVKLAAISVSLNVRPRSADMPASMQERAFRCTRSLLDDKRSTKPSHTHIARSLKKEFDGWYGPAWQCVVGKSFGSFVTHAGGGFVYFTLDDDDDDIPTRNASLFCFSRLPFDL
ncbi:hypothetical protein Scep_007132 [Stephania cephalantha]|uniref:Dynein light chain n=1 Tax=Stephania cephalantha TaxID=152367 RepID=A0AAP0PNJ4_9MAGN